ncbi:MAG TPA: kynureninase [Gammaproteobacteria bacterium]|nr:kynureninase [Gammaproteobacteria bacterium]
MTFNTTPELAQQLDKTDDLRGYRERFYIPRNADGADVVYLCGNSLGLQPKKTADYLQQELEDWQSLGVRGHMQARRPWLPYHELVTPLTAAIVGAKPTEVVNMNSLTANLHLMMVSFYQPTKTRYKILIEKGAFPSDQYAVAAQLRFHGFDPAQGLLELAPRAGEHALRMEDIAQCLEREGDAIALVMLAGVQYYTGQAYDMAEITRLAQQKGCRVGFDLAHAVGNLALSLHDWNMDFAVWCNYKYLNSGPGAVGGCFVHERHARDTSLPRFTGWWGHDKASRFDMKPDFDPTPGAQGWQLSNPPIMALAPVLAASEITAQAGMPALRQKSEQLTGYLEFLLHERLAGKVGIITPENKDQRGCQLSLVVPNGQTVFQALEEAGVVCDWREPDVIRIAPAPLYNTFADVYSFVDILRDVL